MPEGQQHLGLAVSGVFRPEKGAPSLCKALAQQPSNPLPSQRPRPEGPRPAGCSDSSEIGLQITPRVLPKWRVVDASFECADERQWMELWAGKVVVCLPSVGLGKYSL